MAIDRKYGPIEIPGIPADEPVFVLRAQDCIAPQTIDDYYLRAKRIGRPESFLLAVNEALGDFLHWKGPKKQPD